MLEHTFSCPLPLGMHARPASLLQALAQRYQSQITLDNLRNNKVANVRSVFSLIGAEIRAGDPCLLRVHGPDQDQAFQALRFFIENELAQSDVDVAEEIHDSQDVVLPYSLKIAGATYMTGTPAVKALAWAALHVAQTGPLPTRLDVDQVDDPLIEQGRFDRARQGLADTVRGQMRSGRRSVEGQILAAHLGILCDEEFLGHIRLSISHHVSAAQAILDAARHYGQKLRSSESALVRERVLDLEDVCRGLLKEAYGPKAIPSEAVALDRPTILAIDRLTPSAFLALDRENLKGLILGDTGTTSHTVILARGRGLATLTGVPIAALRARHGLEAILDGALGILVIEPDGQTRTYYHMEQARHACRLARLQESVVPKARSLDGVGLEIAANISCSEEAVLAFQHGADGIGVFRTEMLFMDRQGPPDEQEQVAVYRDVLTAAGDRPVIFRTLDIGGDKDVPYLHMDKEDNPLLGNRGVRLYRMYESLFRTQLRAVLQAAERGRPWIMVPMVSTMEEVLWVRYILDQVKAELAGSRGSSVPSMPLGAMVETPAAAMIVDQLCGQLDFFSIGTNDLIQYLLAVDRTNGGVRHLYGGHHPSVLRAIKHIVDEAHCHGKWVGVCGEMAADPLNLPLWLGMGVEEISVAPAAIAALKAEVQGCSAQQARALVDDLVGCRTAGDVKDRLLAWRHQQGRFDLVDPRMVVVDVDVPTKAYAIKTLVDRLYVEGRTDDPVCVENAIWQRESSYSTGLGYGFAIPHCQTRALTADTVAVMKLTRPVEWDSLDGKPVSVVILLVRREGGDKRHLQVLASLGRFLMQEEFRQVLLEANDPEQIVRFLRQKLNLV